ncbi:MAG: O-methyltransferase [Candidatus Berkiella sp.]
MTLDELMSPQLRRYILQSTSKESALLANLRQQTQTQTAFAHMMTGPVEGQFLQMLVKLISAKSCLEVGTFTGYSALHIANALGTDGRLITLEARKHHAEVAQKFFDLSPHGHKITLVLGDATRTLLDIDETFDFIFIDADKANYPFYYDYLLPKLRSNGLMVIDNTLWGGEVIEPKDKEGTAIHTLNQKVVNDERVECVMLSVRDGMLLIRKV